MPITFVVSTESGPGTGTPVADQLATQSGFSSPNALLIPHSSDLLLSFSPNTFTNTNGSTSYYAISADHTPLPSWINFFPNNLSFSGMTPLATSNIELPQTYSIAMSASDVVGFAGATTVFQITVERHLFTFRNDVHILNVSTGSQVSYNRLGSDLLLDGRPANSTDIAHVVTNAPSWLSINNQTLVISGWPPAGVTKQNFTVTTTDIYGESAAASVFISPANDSMAPLLAPIGSVTAKNGSDFQFDLHACLNDPDAAITVGLGTASSWLSFDPRSFKLMGKVPGNIMQQRIMINVTAAHDLKTQTKILTILIVTSCVSATDPSACAGNNAAGASPSGLSSGSKLDQDKRWIALVVVLPVFIIVLSLLLIFYFLRRRKLRRDGWETESSNSSKLGPTRVQTEKDGHRKEEMKMSGALGPHQTPPSSRHSKPPALDVPGFWKTVTTTGIAPRRLSRASSEHARSLSRRDSWNTFANNFNQPRSSTVPIPENDIVEEDATSPNNQAQNRVSKVRANFPRFSISSSSSPIRRYSRTRQTRSNISFASSALMSSQMSGFGHGQSIRSRGSGGMMFSARGIGHGDGSGPPGYGSVRDSWRNFRLLKALANGETSSSSGELYGQYFPQPPHRALTANKPERPSIRLVDPTPPDTSVDIPRPQAPDMTRPSTAQRTDQLKRLQEFHRKRVLLKNAERALFTAGPSSSRVSSYGAKIPTPPVKHTSNSKARLSPRRQSHASDLALFSNARPDDPTPTRHKHRKTLSEISDNSSYQPSSRRQRTPSPIKSSKSPERKEPHQSIQSSSSNFIPTRFPPLSHVSRQNSLMSDDFDSRWESASSDAASMDPYIYSRGLLRSRGTDLASSAGGGGFGSSPSRWTLHGPPPQDSYSHSESSPVRRIAGARRRLLGSSSRQSMDRFVQGIKNVTYGGQQGAKRGVDAADARFDRGRRRTRTQEGDEEDRDDDEDEDDTDDDEANEEQEDEDDEDDEEEEERGRRRRGAHHIRIGGTPRRLVPLGQGGRLRKGDPGNTSFRGDIRRMREGGGEEGGGSGGGGGGGGGGGSAFV